MILYEHVDLQEQAAIAEYIHGETQQVNGFNYQQATVSIIGPVVEIAGPTSQGYAVIDNLVPKPALVTDIDSTKIVDVILDGRHMPFIKNSIGMILTSCLSIRDDTIDYSTRFKDRRVTRRAMREYKLYNGTASSAPTNQRIQVIQEIARVLEPGGLLAWRGSMGHDVKIAQMNGLRPVKWIREKPNLRHPSPEGFKEVLFQKSSK